MRFGMQMLAVCLIFAASKDAGASEIRRVSASRLVSDYRKNGIAADRNYKGHIAEIFGIVGDVQRDIAGKVVVNLSIGDLVRHVRCDFPEAQTSAVADLERGQLVAVRGTVRGSIMGNPQVGDSTLAWLGDKPSTPRSKAETTRAAVIAARSAEVCVLHLAQKETATNIDAKTKRTIEKSLHELEQMKAEPLPCPNPLMLLALICEGDEPHGPECSASLIKSMIANLKR